MLEGVLTRLQRSWVRGHHERWDGRGYPDRQGADEIPVGAAALVDLVAAPAGHRRESA